MAFLLGKGRHNCEHDLTLGIHAINVLFFKIYGYVFIFQLSDVIQAIDCVSRKSAYRLRDYLVYFTRHESIEKDVYQAIGAAYSQAVRSIERVQAGKKFITDSGDEIVIENNSSKYIVCITAENFGIIPSEIDEYIEIDETFGIPYVVNIYDLDIITQECKSYNEFIQYIEFRKKNYEILSTLDELDAFGYFKKKGNVVIAVDADEFFITDFTEEFDKKYKYKDRQVFKEFIKA